MKIHYDHMRNAADVFEEHLKKCSSIFTEYLEILEKVCEEGLKSGDAAVELRSIVSLLNSVRNVPIELFGKLREVVNSLLDDVHKAQVVDGESILYDLKYPDIRDYSSKFFWDLSVNVESQDYDDGIWNKLIDALEDTIVAFACKIFGYCDTSAKDHLIDSQANMLQFKDITAKRLIDIKNNIWDLDARCGANLCDIADTISMFAEFLHKIGQVFLGVTTNGTLRISTEDLNEINGIYFSMMELLNTAISINHVSDEDVIIFLENGLYDRFEDESIDIIDDYLADLSGLELSDWDFWKLIILQMFNIAETELTSQFEGDKVIMKKELLDIMEELSDSFSYTDSDVHEVKDELSTILGYVKKYGNKWKDFYPYDKRTKEYKRLDAFLSDVGDLTDFLKYGDKAVEILAPMFTNYEKNLEFLDSMEEYFTADGTMKTAFAEIRSQYEKEMSSRYEEIKTFALEEAIDAAYDLSVGKYVKAIKKTIEIIGTATGDIKRTGAQYELVTYGHDMVRMSTTALGDSLEKLGTLTEGTPEYEEVMADVKNNFNLYKTTLTHLFEKIAEASSGDDTSYYMYCAQEVSKMKISDLNKLHLLSKEEYLNQANVW